MALEPPTAALQEFRPPVRPTLRQAGSSRVDSEFCDSVIQPQAMDVGHAALGGPPTRQFLDPSRSRMSLVISTLAIRTQPSLGGNLDRLGFRYTRECPDGAVRSRNHRRPVRLAVGHRRSRPPGPGRRHRLPCLQQHQRSRDTGPRSWQARRVAWDSFRRRARWPARSAAVAGAGTRRCDRGGTRYVPVLTRASERAMLGMEGSPVGSCSRGTGAGTVRFHTAVSTGEREAESISQHRRCVHRCSVKAYGSPLSRESRVEVVQLSELLRNILIST